MSNEPSDNRQSRIEDLASRIIESAESSVLMNCRFIRSAMGQLTWEARPGSAGFFCDGEHVYYDPALVIRRFKNDKNSISRIMMHILMHFVFHHGSDYEKKRTDIWDLACDIAVENIIMEIGVSQLALKDDPKRTVKLAVLSERAKGLTAQSLYRLMLVEEPSIRETEELISLFKRDSHELWVPKEKEEIVISAEQWKRISERVKADLKSFSKGSIDAKSLEAALNEATRERIDYSDFLRKFMVCEETIKASNEEFDYIYYTYGLSTYKNMPLIEPLEYSDQTKIREFVIVIDTSASTSGDLVIAFLKQTVNILMDAKNFFNDINVHIIQCDSEVRSDDVIKSREELEEFVRTIKVSGYGSTDFVPAFEYVDDLLAKGVLYNLKGLVYFTDGYGTYPTSMPVYDTAFVFMRDDGNAPAVPDWAIRVVMDEEQLTGQNM